MRTTNIARARRGQAGFSLIEIMVAMSVTLIALTGAMALYVSLAKANDSTGRASEATALAKETLEEIRGTRFSDLTTSFGATPIDTALTDRLGRAGQSFTRQLIITDVDADLVSIRVEISWTDAGAVPGSSGGRYDHSIALMLVRWRADIT